MCAEMSFCKPPVTVGCEKSVAATAQVDATPDIKCCLFFLQKRGRLGHGDLPPKGQKSNSGPTPNRAGATRAGWGGRGHGTPPQRYTRLQSGLPGIGQNSGHRVVAWTT